MQEFSFSIGLLAESWKAETRSAFLVIKMEMALTLSSFWRYGKWNVARNPLITFVCFVIKRLPTLSIRNGWLLPHFWYAGATFFAGRNARKCFAHFFCLLAKWTRTNNWSKRRSKTKFRKFQTTTCRTWTSRICSTTSCFTTNRRRTRQSELSTTRASSPNPRKTETSSFADFAAEK